MTDFEIRHAVRVNTPAFIALAGPSGSGKTRSALELATGLAGDGKILLADTEGNRALHYADLYNFDHVEFRPPYTPDRCAQLIDLAEDKGYAVLITDSASDEHEGEGGLQDIRDAYRSKTQPDVPGSGDEFWGRTKARHKHALVNRIRRARIHTIWCLRAEERVRITKAYDERTRRMETVVEHMGWQPICEKRFLYEMQSSFRFEPGEHAGEPIPIKLYDIHGRFFPANQKITREAGRALAAWAAGAAAPVSVKPSLTELAHEKADEGTDGLRAWLKDLSSEELRSLRPMLGTRDKPGELTIAAQKADAQMVAERHAVTHPDFDDETESPEPGNHSDGKAPSVPQAAPQPAPAHDAQPAREPEPESPSLSQSRAREGASGAVEPERGTSSDSDSDRPSLTRRLARIDEMLRTTAEGGLGPMEKLFKRQLPDDQRSLAAFLPEYEQIARRAIAEAP